MGMRLLAAPSPLYSLGGCGGALRKLELQYAEIETHRNSLALARQLKIKKTQYFLGQHASLNPLNRNFRLKIRDSSLARLPV